jgi:hypothetical protein
VYWIPNLRLTVSDIIPARCESWRYQETAGNLVTDRVSHQLFWVRVLIHVTTIELVVLLVLLILFDYPEYRQTLWAAKSDFTTSSWCSLVTLLK